MVSNELGMELRKLTKENLGGRSKKGLPTISFTRRGLVILSQKTVEKLEIDLKSKNDSLVDVFEGPSISEFFISKGSTYKVRQNGDGGAVFNCSTLSELVIERSWRVHSHNALEPAPNKFSFIVCDKPVDDKENSNIFALLRKKV